MAYVPPHKRYSKHIHGTTSLAPQRFLPSNSHRNPNKKVQGSMLCDYTVYAKNSINTLMLVTSTDSDSDHDDQLLLPSIHLKQVPTDSILHKDGKQLMVLVCNNPPPPQKDVHEKTPWVSIVERIQENLVASFQNARKEMCIDESEIKLPHLVFRFGKILFHGDPSISLDNVHKTSVAETALSKLKRMFNTDVSNSFVQAVLGNIIHKLGADFEEETEYYHVKVSDKSRPNSTITCKCDIIKPLGELDLFQIELNQMRHLVVDMSCLERNLDLRLMLASKRVFTSLSDDEKHSLKDLLKSAVIDPGVKGGLRWPPGKESMDGRFVVVGAWHAKAKTFKNSFMRIKVRHADRFDFRLSTGEVSEEVSLIMTELSTQLTDTTLQMDHFTDMVRDALKVIWENVLCWEGSLI